MRSGRETAAMVAAALGVTSRAVALPDPSVVGSPSSRPTQADAWAEILGIAAGLRLPAAGSRLLRAPRGDGHVVFDIPGWKAPEASGAPLRGYLRWLGYDARPWGFGSNEGFPERDAPRLAERVRAAAALHGPVSLVGWSLGGVIGREVAREHPESVRRLITYGTPIIGGPTHTLGAAAYGRDESARIAALTEDLDRSRPITVPTTCVYTRRDHVVAWEACVDHYSLDVEHVEVRSTHIGLGVDPDVWSIIADRLAIPEDDTASR